MKTIVSLLAATASLFLIIGSLTGFLPLSPVEVFGFVTGAVCVWLTVKENIWSWPIGLANNVFFILLFLDARLYADMGLQVVYIVLGILGWYWWLRGGTGKTKLLVNRTPVRQWFVILPLAALATYGMTNYLASIGDSAPFLDALTTVLSLVAQYLLSRKYLENWIVWITADVIYIGLYFAKALPLTAVLYAMFLMMCIAGFKRWSASLTKRPATMSVTTACAETHC